MAQKRMFDRAIIDTDKFIDLPITAKALYFLLGVEADDEGFVSPKKVLRLHGGTEDDIKILAAKGLVIPFESGVVVITDWHTNNYLDKNRMKPTQYVDEKEQLSLVSIGKNRNSSDLKYVLTGSENRVFNNRLTGVKLEEKRREENICKSKDLKNPSTLEGDERSSVTKRKSLAEEEYQVVPVNEHGDQISPRKKPATWDAEKAVFQQFSNQCQREVGVLPEPASLWQLKRIRVVMQTFDQRQLKDLFDDWFSTASDDQILNVHAALSTHNLNKFKMQK